MLWNGALTFIYSHRHCLFAFVHKSSAGYWLCNLTAIKMKCRTIETATHFDSPNRSSIYPSESMCMCVCMRITVTESIWPVKTQRAERQQNANGDVPKNPFWNHKISVILIIITKKKCWRLAFQFKVTGIFTCIRSLIRTLFLFLFFSSARWATQ